MSELDNEDLELNDDLELDDEVEEDQEDAEAADDGDQKPDPKAEKRIKDLQSKADKETARANKAEADLKAALKAKAPQKDKQTQEVPESIQKWLDAAQETTRTQLFESDPRFKEYGLDPSLIVGDEPSDMRQSAKELKKLVDRIESRARSSIMKEMGINPEPSTSDRTTGKKNFATMSAKEILALADSYGS